MRTLRERSTIAVATLVCLLALPAAVLADILEVRKTAPVYAEPNKHSERLALIDPATPEGPYVLPLIAGERSRGYYHVQLPGHHRSGWIYRTYVRRFPGPHPAYVGYKRSLYRHWVDEDGDCQDARQETLIRDADGPLRYEDARQCRVRTGTWVDPYTGNTFHEPRQLDVDHLVPLKNAHESGAWAWSSARRRQYANNLNDNAHLIAVAASENRKKGAKGPDLYLPPATSYRCEYVRAWIRIKERWELTMTEDEGTAVDAILRNCQ